jgi:hypothetical protein
MFRFAVPIALLLISPVLYADGPICGPHPRGWDKDHALIEEVDLTLEQVKKAQAYVEAAKRPAPDAPGELEMLAAAGVRIIEGHKLKQEYERRPSPAAKQQFCAWMANYAYWPE